MNLAEIQVDIKCGAQFVRWSRPYLGSCLVSTSRRASRSPGCRIVGVTLGWWGVRPGSWPAAQMLGGQSTIRTDPGPKSHISPKHAGQGFDRVEEIRPADPNSTPSRRPRSLQPMPPGLLAPGADDAPRLRELDEPDFEIAPASTSERSSTRLAATPRWSVFTASTERHTRHGQHGTERNYTDGMERNERNGTNGTARTKRKGTARPAPHGTTDTARPARHGGRHGTGACTGAVDSAGGRGWPGPGGEAGRWGRGWLENPVFPGLGLDLVGSRVIGGVGHSGSGQWRRRRVTPTRWCRGVCW